MLILKFCSFRIYRFWSKYIKEYVAGSLICDPSESPRKINRCRKEANSLILIEIFSQQKSMSGNHLFYLQKKIVLKI